jgi:Helix-loop-helix DNA-binding domain
MDDSLLPSELAKMSRSERKRHREKKRRSDVNKGFDDLMALLLEIDPTVRAEAEDRARRGQWKGTFGAQEDSMLSRVDLISRAVDVLRRVHCENEERKQIIARFTGTGTTRVSQQDSSVTGLPSYVGNLVQNQGRVDSSDVVHREVRRIW